MFVLTGVGGYQAPARPAAVSGPGAGSRRTDGGPVQKLQTLTDAQYGEGKTFHDTQKAAPLAQVPSTPSASSQGLTPQQAGVIPFGAPTMRPDEPVSAGAALGPGVGPDAMGLPQPSPGLAAQNVASQVKTLAAASQGNPAVQWLLGSMQARGV